MNKNLDELKGALDALLLLSKKAKGEKIKTVKSNNKEDNLLKLPDIFNDDDFENADFETEEEQAELLNQNDNWSEDNWEDKRREKLKDLESSDSINDFEDQLRKEKAAKEKAKKQDLELKRQEKIKKDWFNSATPLSRLSGGKDYADFIASFRMALAQQTEESDEEEETFHRINPNYYSGKYRLPGIENTEKATKPKIQLYIDLSGSLNSSDFDKAKSLIAQLELYRRQEKLEYEVYFFADTVSKNPQGHRNERGTNAYIDILTNINQTKPNNVIIFTDDDFDDYANRWSSKSSLSNLFKVQVPGVVWWVFCGTELEDTYKFLTGRKKTFTFKIR